MLGFLLTAAATSRFSPGRVDLRLPMLGFLLTAAATASS
jgi:hypothetical protein